MSDQIRTKDSQKLRKERYISQLDYMATYIKRSCRFCIQSALTIKTYLEQFFDGVPFRGCTEKKNILKMSCSLPNNENKQKISKNSYKEDWSITDMAKKVGLSRIRFYQLRKEGVFPQPDYSTCSNRSFYTLNTQQRCLEIRKTGIGLNGERIYFNTPRTKRQKKSRTSRNRQNTRYEKLAAILRQWRWDVTPTDVKTVVTVIYPKGLEQHPDDGRVLRDVIDYYMKNGTINKN